MNKIICGAVSLAIVCGMGFSALAQTDAEVERSIDAQRRQQETISAINSAGGLLPVGRKVTYQELLKDPDNIELNILYARYQISQGKLTDAQSALERVLLLYPDVSVVRMLYGLVLFRLDNLADAEAEFNKLLDSDISNADKALVQGYLGQIASKQKRTHITLSGGFGVHFDDNRNAATKSGLLTLTDVTFASGAKEKDDFGTTLNASGEVRYDLGFQRPQDAYGKLSIMVDQMAAQKAQQMFLGRVDLGTTMQVDIGKIDLSANISKINVDRKAYMTTTGLKARWDANPGQVVTPYVEGNYQYQFYNGLQGVTAAPQKTGNRWDGKIGVQTTSLIENGISGVSVNYTVKQAREKFNEFKGFGLSLDHTQVFEKGRFLLGNVSFNNDVYAAADPFIDTTKKRHDRRYDLSLTAGAPLGSFVESKTLPDQLNDVVVTATVGRSDSRSNIYNYAYDNWRSQFMINKTIRF